MGPEYRIIERDADSEGEISLELFFRALTDLSLMQLVMALAFISTLTGNIQDLVLPSLSANPSLVDVVKPESVFEVSVTGSGIIRLGAQAISPDEMRKYSGSQSLWRIAADKAAPWELILKLMTIQQGSGGKIEFLINGGSDDLRRAHTSSS